MLELGVNRMDALFSILSGLSMIIGVVALLIGSLGLVRLPDVYSRIHAVGMIDTAGVAFIILGMLFYAGFSLISVKLAAIGIFLFFTGPIATHAVAQVAYRNGIEPVLGVSPAAQKAIKKVTPKKAAPKKVAVKKAVAKKVANKKVNSKKPSPKAKKGVSK